MVYMGSKAKIAKYIVPIIQRKIDESGARYYIEPFAGGCNVIDKIKAEYCIASDKNEYLIALFIHLQAGGGLPEYITKEEYDEVREAYRNKSGIFPAWYIGAVGFLASYKGRFFEGGYSGIRKTSGGVRNYYKESRNNILRQMQWMYDTTFVSADYRDFTPHESVIYCDPPYKGTKQYGSATFDYVEFWEIMRSWSKHNIVLISELQAPDDFTVIWEKEVVRSMKANERFRATEKLFMLGGVTVND